MVGRRARTATGRGLRALDIGRPARWRTAPFSRWRAIALVSVALAVLAFLVLSLQLGAAGDGRLVASPMASAPTPGHEPHPLAIVPAAPSLSSIVHLALNVTPGAICDDDSPDCPLGVAQATITMTERAGLRGQNAWPAVQVVFLLETTPYDGVYDPSAEVPGADPCGDTELGEAPLCDESNGVPFFVTNAGSITSTIQATNPNSSYSFALVDYYATHDQWDSGGARSTGWTSPSS